MKKEYKIIGEYRKDDLEKSITFFINNGWELVGGICVSSAGYFYQAIVK